MALSKKSCCNVWAFWRYTCGFSTKASALQPMIIKIAVMREFLEVHLIVLLIEANALWHRVIKVAVI